MVSTQAAQLLIEKLIQTCGTLDQIMGQLGGDIDLVPQVILLQDLTQSRFAAAVDVGGVEVVDALLNGQLDFPFRFLHVDTTLLLRKPQAAKAQHRKRIAVFIQPIIHKYPTF